MQERRKGFLVIGDDLLGPQRTDQLVNSQQGVNHANVIQNGRAAVADNQLVFHGAGRYGRRRIDTLVGIDKGRAAVDADPLFDIDTEATHIGRVGVLDSRARADHRTDHLSEVEFDGVFIPRRGNVGAQQGFFQKGAVRLDGDGIIRSQSTEIND